MTNAIQITVKLATVLSRHTDNQRVIDFRLQGAVNLSAVLDSLDERFPGIKDKICRESNIVDSINVYVNGDNVRYLQGVNTSIKQDAVINIIPATAAG